MLRALRRACSARTDALASHAPTRTPRAPARLPGASPGAQMSASSGAQLARPATCARRILSASRGAQPARLRGVRSVCFLSRTFLTLVLLLWCPYGWATFVLSHIQRHGKRLRLVNPGPSSHIWLHLVAELVPFARLHKQSAILYLYARSPRCAVIAPRNFGLRCAFSVHRSDLFRREGVR